MKTALLGFVVLSLAPLAYGSQPCTPAREKLALTGRDELTSRYETVLARTGNNGSGIGLCAGGEITRGLRGTANSREMNNGSALCGITLYFKNARGKDAFGAAFDRSEGFGSEISVSTGSRSVRVPVCAEVIGEIRPQPGASVRN